jgi:hypothetical protein
MQAIRLSEAIRLGSAIHPQIFKRCFQWSAVFVGRIEMLEMLKKGQVPVAVITGTCAMGAALFAVGAREEDILISWPWLASPEHKFIPRAITNMNDHQRMKREEIADWVERYEIEHNVYADAPPTDVVCRNCLVKQEPLESCVSCGRKWALGQPRRLCKQEPLESCVSCGEPIEEAIPCST